MTLSSEECFQNIHKHQSLEELSLSLALSWVSLYQLQGIPVGQFQLSRKSFVDQLEVICEHKICYLACKYIIPSFHVQLAFLRPCINLHKTYIVYCSGHFSRKAASTFLRGAVVMPLAIALGPKNTHTMTSIISGVDIFE